MQSSLVLRFRIRLEMTYSMSTFEALMSVIHRFSIVEVIICVEKMVEDARWLHI